MMIQSWIAISFYSYLSCRQWWWFSQRDEKKAKTHFANHKFKSSSSINFFPLKRAELRDLNPISLEYTAHWVHFSFWWSEYRILIMVQIIYILLWWHDLYEVDFRKYHDFSVILNDPNTISAIILWHYSYIPAPNPRIPKEEIMCSRIIQFLWIFMARVLEKLSQNNQKQFF